MAYYWPMTVNGVTYNASDFTPFNYVTKLPDLLGNFAAYAESQQASKQAILAESSALSARASAQLAMSAPALASYGHKKPNQVEAAYVTATTWAIRSSAADITWRSVAWAPELGLFCAISDTGAGNRVMTSPDGINWTIRTSAADNAWFGICWAPELNMFCAIANTGTVNRVMTSPDGITWTLRASASALQWTGICWSPELNMFCAVATSGTGSRVMTSPDGINWTLRATPADNSWRSVVWAPELGLFCAISDTGSGNRVMTSPDGINWTTRTSAADNSWFSVCWAPELGTLCSVGASGSGNRAMTVGAYPGNLSYRRRSPGHGTIANADATISVGVNPAFLTQAATLTANRTITLSAAYAVAGDRFNIKRTSGGAFTLAIVNGGAGGGTLRTGASGTAFTGEYVFDGANWTERFYVAA